jgi:anion-transporting  ArsA/GET3 family ATPase
VASVLERRLIVVSGKGGVGKTTVSGALGLLGARRGLRTIVVEVTGGEAGGEAPGIGRLSAMLGHSAPPPHGVETQLGEGLWGLAIDRDRVLGEWLRAIGGRVPARVLTSSSSFQYLIAAAPGAREMITMVKLWELAQGRRPGDRRARNGSTTAGAGGGSTAADEGSGNTAATGARDGSTATSAGGEGTAADEGSGSTTATGARDGSTATSAGGEGTATSAGDERDYDLIVFDAPATGHALAMLRSPHTFGTIARVGPVARQAGQVRELLEDPARTAYLAVTQATEMGVTETLELREGLRDGLSRELDAVIVNGTLPRRFEGEDLQRITALGGGRAGGQATVVRVSAARTAHAVHERALAQQRQIARLLTDLRSVSEGPHSAPPVVRVPFMFRSELDLAAIQRIASRLERSL